jgi:transcriptional regulator with XRE-family HTH domain
MRSKTVPSAGVPARRNPAAAKRLTELRCERGLIVQDVPSAMLASGIGFSYVPSAKTLWRIETKGAEPTERFKFGLAQFYGVTYRELWS